MNICNNFFQNIMQLYDIKQGNKIYDFKLDVGTISTISGKKRHTEMFFSFYSFLTPNIIFRVNFNESGVSNESVKHF